MSFLKADVFLFKLDTGYLYIYKRGPSSVYRQIRSEQKKQTKKKMAASMLIFLLVAGNCDEPCILTSIKQQIPCPMS